MAPTKAAPLELDGSRLVYADGAARAEALSPDQEVALWARCLHEGRPGLVEVVAGYRLANGSLRMRQRRDRERFPAAGNLRALLRLVRRHREAGDEVFCTPLTRQLPRPGRGVGCCPARWSGSTSTSPPRSGASCLPPSPPPGRLLRLGRRPRLLAAVAPGRPCRSRRSQSQARRPSRGRPGLLRPRPHHAAARHPQRQGRQAVPAGVRRPGPSGDRARRARARARGSRPADPPPDAETLRRWAKRNALDDARQVPPPVYFRLLAGVEVAERGGDVRCPLPDRRAEPLLPGLPDRRAGLGLLRLPARRSIYDLASLLERGPGGRRGALHGEDFKRVKQRVWELLGLAH